MVILLCTILVIYVTMVYGPIAAWLVELFPARIRYTSMSLPYHIGNGWFGGFLPVTSFAIVAATGNIYNGLWYPIVVAAITVVIGGAVPARDCEDQNCPADRRTAATTLVTGPMGCLGRPAKTSSPCSPEDPLLSAAPDEDTPRNKCERHRKGRHCLGPPHKKTKEWSHEVMDIARHRRAGRWVSPVRHFTRRNTPQPTDEEISEEIVVTAQKRATSLQEVPFSVAAMTGQDIRESGATNIVEVARNVPGLYITDLGPGQSQVAIRGISAGQVVRDQPGVKESVGIYLDESPISVALFTPDLDLYDLDRIEVLRGPQGTLFGAGSSSGTVRYITAQPNVGEFGGSADFTLDERHGRRDRRRSARRVQRCRSVRRPRCGSWATTASSRDSSTLTIRAAHVIEDVNSGTRTGGRLAFRFEPSENFVITPRVVYQKLETDGYPRVDDYNMLGNPYTTTEPAVDPGERGQVTQLRRRAHR